MVNHQFFHHFPSKHLLVGLALGCIISACNNNANDPILSIDQQIEALTLFEPDPELQQLAKELGIKYKVTRTTNQDSRRLKNPDTGKRTGTQQNPWVLSIHNSVVSTPLETIGALAIGNVSVHYLIDQEGNITQLITEANIAWSEGFGEWRNNKDVNSVAISFMAVNPSNPPKELVPYDEQQMRVLGRLISLVKDRYKIADRNVIGQCDMATNATTNFYGRKETPCSNFPWQDLKEKYNVGAWPNKELKLEFVQKPLQGEEVKWMQAMLHLYGYTACPQSGILDEQTQAAIKVFKLHFDPRQKGQFLKDILPTIDQETIDILASLVDQYVPEGEYRKLLGVGR